MYASSCRAQYSVYTTCARLSAERKYLAFANCSIQCNAGLPTSGKNSSTPSSDTRASDWSSKSTDAENTVSGLKEVSQFDAQSVSQFPICLKSTVTNLNRGFGVWGLGFGVWGLGD